ncbi:unnamed protein product [Mucor circinelloides]
MLRPKNENAHNDSLTLEECQLLRKTNKKFLIGSDTIDDVVQKMIGTENSVPEIKKKTIDRTDGKSILTYDDIRNWKVEVMSHDKSIDKFGNSASDLIRRIEGRGYIVGYQVSSDGKNVKPIFFMHSSAAAEINVRREVFGIDATYKVNNKAMPLVSIQSVVSHLGGKSLMTSPIVYNRRASLLISSSFNFNPR